MDSSPRDLTYCVFLRPVYSISIRISPLELLENYLDMSQSLKTAFDSNGDIPGSVNGYPSLASLMAKHPYLTIFKRFRALIARDLLYYQAELTDLEVSLHHQDLESRNGDTGRVLSQNQWKYLVRNTQQFDTVLKMRTCLKEYSE